MMNRKFRRDAILRPLKRMVDNFVIRELKHSLKSCASDVRIGMPIVVEQPDKVVFEDGVSIAAFVHIWGNGGVRVGARTMIGSHTAISSATHDPEAEYMGTSMIALPVVIEHDVWIGAHSVIFPGVTIGAHAIVAAGSVVRHNVAPYSVVAGVPAKLVRACRLDRSAVNKSFAKRPLP
jgi:maltose O-acetyltransferase